MSQVSITIEIAVPPQVVWAVMADVERWPEWTPTVTRIQRLTPGPLAVGSRVRIHQPRLRPALWQISELNEGRSFTWFSAAPGVRVTGRHDVEMTATGSRATLSLEFTGLFGGLAARLTRGLNERYLALEANELKARSEGCSSYREGFQMTRSTQHPLLREGQWNVAMKSIALGFLRIAVVTQFAWILIERLRFNTSWNQLLYPTLVSVGFGLLAVAPERLRWLPAPLRIFIGFAFTGAICDRLGLFGGPGTPGVSWGNFKNFVAYTAQVNSFLPAALIPSLAAIESMIEGALGAAMMLGFSVRKVSVASAALLCCLGLAMTISLGLASQFPFAAFVLTAGALVLATLDTSSRWSVDALFLRLRRRRSESAHGKST